MYDEPFEYFLWLSLKKKIKEMRENVVLILVPYYRSVLVVHRERVYKIFRPAYLLTINIFYIIVSRALCLSGPGGFERQRVMSYAILFKIMTVVVVGIKIIMILWY